MSFYRRTQFGTANVVALLAGLCVVWVISLYVGWHPASILVAGILVVAMVLFCTLTIEVDRRLLRCSFGPGLIRKSFPLEEIVSAKAVQNRWYYGWGIRLTPHGWLFNVSGLEAVELQLVQGNRFRIGTLEPEAVVLAIEQAKESWSP